MNSQHLYGWLNNIQQWSKYPITLTFHCPAVGPHSPTENEEGAKGHGGKKINEVKQQSNLSIDEEDSLLPAPALWLTFLSQMIKLMEQHTTLQFDYSVQLLDGHQTNKKETCFLFKTLDILWQAKANYTASDKQTVASWGQKARRKWGFGEKSQQ